MNIIGISAFYHDSAVAIVQHGEIVAAAQEERFSRKKNDDSFPTQALDYCLKQSGLSLAEIDAVVFYDKPLLKFERLLETYLAFFPRGWRSFITSMPVWISRKLFLKKIIRNELKKIEPDNKKRPKLLFCEHHLSHAASAYYPSAFTEAAVLVADGVGEWATVSIYHAQGNQLKVLRELHFPDSPGLLYSAFTYYLGFKVNSGEYKVMGLAPYGNLQDANTQAYIKKIKENLVELKEDGSIKLNMNYFDFATGLTMIHDKKWNTLFGLERRAPESPIKQLHCNLALAVQCVIEEVMLKMAIEAKHLTGSDNLCMAGGVALNCVANEKVLNASGFKNVYVQPAAGDAGGSLGAALAAWHIYFKKGKTAPVFFDNMNGSYLGPQYSEEEVKIVVERYKANFDSYLSFDAVCKKTSALLKEGNVIGWFQGRMEFGPRALGNRSILGDTANVAMQQKINLNIKFREGFRPFAPAVLSEDTASFFDMENSSPYMLFVKPVKQSWRCTLPANYAALQLNEKLNVVKSSFPAITHVDYSARVQTVHQETNPLFWQLLNEFKKQTGNGMLVNTSFNVRGEPIVCSPQDAYRCFMKTKMDYLVLGNLIFDKSLQPVWQDENDQKQFETD